MRKISSVLVFYFISSFLIAQDRSVPSPDDLLATTVHKKDYGVNLYAKHRNGPWVNYQGKNYKRLEQDLTQKRLQQVERMLKLWHFDDKPVWTTGQCPRFEDVEGTLVYVKAGDNLMLIFFVIHIYVVQDGKDYLTDDIALVSFKVEYGEVVESSKSYKLLTKKRLYPKNNIFTQEIPLNDKMYLIVEKDHYIKTFGIRGYKEFDVTNKGVTFCH